MIALVLVAHSPELLAGLRSMVGQAAPAVPIAIAGGTSVGNLGTSSPVVLEALRSALAGSAGDGAVVLFDLGSAVMALEMALEELVPADRARVRVSRGPLVEGAVRAAVEAAGGASLDEVVAVADAERGVEKLPADWPADAVG